MTRDKLEERTAARREILRTLLGARRHAEGCPEELTDTGGVEGFDIVADAPSHPDLRGVEPGSTVTTIRCLLCSGERFLPGRVDDNVDRLMDAS